MGGSVLRDRIPFKSSHKVRGEEEGKERVGEGLTDFL